MEPTVTLYHSSSTIFQNFLNKKALMSGSKANKITDLFIFFRMVWTLPKKILTGIFP